ncbi:hypothetical protein NEOLEDRAFT_1142706 [Neolentinus lepideus HHB14362 ss-1]|uniref:Zn(2)-C6 fungal-type domain-containing protein n=1 Tax=Neolentinus lepideus HHB14362 ss-1 TaxID=1314782 RepID=A0A165MZV9_9AGAM|nr:hypothetical protein NEOLEDRAFT_1142706 [Neolentinus lepideus HHB14362 ss-1]
MSSGEHATDSNGRHDQKRTASAAERKRIQRACDQCRHRKVRCDGMQMLDKQCSNCSGSKVPCTYLEVMKKRGPSKSAADDLETRLKRMEDILDNIHSHAGDRQDLGRIEPLGANAASPGAPHTNPVSSRSPSVDPDEPDLTEDGYSKLTESLKRLMTDTNHRRYVGKSSGFAFLQSTIALRREYRSESHASTSRNATVTPCIRPKFWIANPWEELKLPAARPSILHFPPDDLLISLVDLYFANINIFYPLFHEPTFRHNLAQKLHERDQEFGAVVLMVCACAARWSNDSRVLVDWSHSHHSAGWKYLNECTLVSKNLLSPLRPVDLQLAALAAMFFAGSSVPQCAWGMTGLGIHAAQDIGIHRRTRSGSQERAELYETWKRTFWVLIALDRDFSSGLGRACAIQDEDFDLDMPIECDDEYWTTTPSGPCFAQPSDKPSKLAYFSWYIKLDQIISFALRTIYSINKSKLLLGFVGPDWEQRVVSQLDSALNEWAESLPDHLRWDPKREDNVFFLQSAYLYCNYYRVRILVHRPFIPVPGKPSRLHVPSLTICADASRSMVRVIDVARRRAEGPFPIFVYPALMSAGIILLFKICNSRKTSGVSLGPAEDMEDLQRCLSALKQTEESWYFAGRLVDIICDLASVGDVSLPSIRATSQAKRRREPDEQSSQDGSSSTARSRMALELAADPCREPAPSGPIITTEFEETSSSEPQPITPQFLPIHTGNAVNTPLTSGLDMSNRSAGQQNNASSGVPYHSYSRGHEYSVINSAASAGTSQATHAPGYLDNLLPERGAGTSLLPDDWTNILGSQSFRDTAGEPVFSNNVPEEYLNDNSFEAWANTLAEFGLDELGAYVANTGADHDLVYGSVNTTHGS